MNWHTKHWCFGVSDVIENLSDVKVTAFCLFGGVSWNAELYFYSVNICMFWQALKLVEVIFMKKDAESCTPISSYSAIWLCIL